MVPRIWYVQSNKGDFARLARVSAVVRRANDWAAFGGARVSVYLDEPGTPRRLVGTLTEAMFWGTVNDERLSAAIDRFEIEGR